MILYQVPLIPCIMHMLQALRQSLPRLANFLRNIYSCREIVRTMAAHELANRYVGTLGGALWTIAHPVAMILVYWFVFSVGFKAQGPAGMPFTLYFVSGLLPWLFFSETITASIASVTGNAHLVKKLVFPTEVLPVVHIVAGLVPHAALLAVFLVLLAHYGIYPNVYMVQLVYYMAMLIVLTLGIGWLLAALHVFYRDIGQAMTVLLNFWFWLTPIVWTINIVPERYRWLLHLNPFYYLVEGYRNALVYKKPLWVAPHDALYFILIAMLLLMSGAAVFRRLKPEFPDML